MLQYALFWALEEPGKWGLGSEGVVWGFRFSDNFQNGKCNKLRTYLLINILLGNEKSAFKQTQTYDLYDVQDSREVNPVVLPPKPSFLSKPPTTTLQYLFFGISALPFPKNSYDITNRT